MKATNYAQPFYDALMQGVAYDIAHTRLKESMVRRGHIKLYPAVLRATEHLITVAAQKNIPKLTLARHDDLDTLTQKITSHGIDPTSCQITVNPKIIGGYSLTHQNMRHDATHKNALYKAYQNITITR